MKEDRLVSVKEVAKALGIGVSTVWLWVQQGRLPEPIKLGDRCTRWKMSAIQSVIEGGS